MTRLVSIYIFILLAFAAGIWLYAARRGESSSQMSGTITAIHEGVITVSGPVESGDSGEDRTIEFAVTPETVFTKTALLIEKEHFPESGVGQSFEPPVSESAGSFNDLKVGTYVIRLVSRGNLLKTEKARATTINYQSIEYEQ